MKRILIVMFLFLIFWIILAEKISFEVAVLGIFICLWTYVFNHGFNVILTKNFWTLDKIRHMIIYLFILVKEIVIANFQVAKVVMSRDMKITPTVVHFRTRLKSDLNRTILANSITLTPGTLTVQMENDLLTIHCLQKDYVEHVLNSKFEKILLKVEE
ncbi:MAG: multicomponent Na+:H+ antiporter subunit [Clostridiales bacterium]|nr:multicomponent Na+:H+ antiporter subunit [Clostridiales bacterium]MDK2933912.1 multicomponent Na+:H+ antiporter subunit [Clostridiales bacterium]